MLDESGAIAGACEIRLYIRDCAPLCSNVVEHVGDLTFLTQPAKRQVPSFLRERLGDAQADAARPARHQRCSAIAWSG
jgi:hypothetical protein